MISYIRIFHICPETNGSGKIFPHSFVFPHTFLTLIDKWHQSVFLDLVFSVQTKLLLHFQLYRKSVGIPSGLSGNHISLHGTVSGDHILDYTGKHMADMRFSICSRRSVIEGISRSFLAVFHALLENVIVFPELLDFFFPIYKIQVCSNFLVHSFFSFPKFKNILQRRFYSFLWNRKYIEKASAL